MTVYHDTKTNTSESDVVFLVPGKVIMSWCSKHEGAGGYPGKSTRHLWENWHLTCLECNPEKDPEKQQTN